MAMRIVLDSKELSKAVSDYVMKHYSHLLTSDKGSLNVVFTAEKTKWFVPRGEPNALFQAEVEEILDLEDEVPVNDTKKE